MPSRSSHGAIALVALLAAAACTRVSDRSRFEGPAQPLEIVDTTPLPGETGIDPEIRVDLCMSDRLDPRSVGEVDATISSGGAVLDSQLSVQLLPWLAPGTDEVPSDTASPWCEGSVLSVRPGAALPAGALVRLRLRPSAVGWEGESLATDGPLWVGEVDDPRYILEFTVDPEPHVPPARPGDPPEASPPTLTDLFATGGPFDPARSECSCHRDPDDLALARLDLRDPNAAFAGLLGDPRPRDTGFPMVAPRDPSQSFLLQKLLRTDDGEALHGILGDAMPPDEPLPYADVLRIALWIEAGAAP